MSPTTTKKSPKASQVFTTEEKAAMRQRAKEMKEAANTEEAEQAVVAAIREMKGADRAKAEGIHAIIKANAPDLSARLWYGMPAYARDGKIICFFQPAEKFKTRYATFGFNDSAHLDEGAFWPV